MDSKEARALLGVGEAASSDQIRRAYLAQVKKHNPEVDPDGFAQIRGAFEHLKLERDLAERYGEESQATTTKSSPAPPPPDDEQNVDADQAAAVSAPRGPTEAPDLESIAKQFAAIGFFDQDAKCEFLLKAWDKPSVPLLHFTLDKLLPIPVAREGLAKCLRKAADAGLTQALFILGRLAPYLITDTELARLLNDDDERDRLFGAHILTFRGDAAGVKEVALEILNGPPDFPTSEMLDLALFALQRAQLGLAMDLCEALKARFQRYQDEATILGHEEILQWAAFRELSGLARWVPTKYVADVAALFRGEPVPSASYLASKLLESQGLLKVDATRARIEKEAPTVYQVLAMGTVVMYVDPEKQPFRLPRISFGGAGFFVIYALFKIIQCAATSSSSNIEPAQYNIDPAAYQHIVAEATRQGMVPVRVPQPAAATNAGDMAEQNMYDIVSQACPTNPGATLPTPRAGRDKPAEALKLACKRMRALLTEWEDHECDGLKNNWLDRADDIPATTTFLKWGRFVRDLRCSDSTDGR